MGDESRWSGIVPHWLNQQDPSQLFHNPMNKCYRLAGLILLFLLSAPAEADWKFQKSPDSDHIFRIFDASTSEKGAKEGEYVYADLSFVLARPGPNKKHRWMGVLKSHKKAASVQSIKTTGNINPYVKSKPLVITPVKSQKGPTKNGYTLVYFTISFSDLASLRKEKNTSILVKFTTDDGGSASHLFHLHDFDKALKLLEHQAGKAGLGMLLK